MESKLDECIRLTLKDIPKASKIMARAFFNDVLIKDYLVPDEAKREKVLSEIFNRAIGYGILYGEVYAPSPNLEGIAVWHPPHKKGRSIWTVLRSGGLSLLYKVGIDVVKRLITYEELVLEIRKKYVNFPHWYLSPIAVDPGLQGEGHGSQLIRPMLEKIDKKGTACFLETHTMENVEMYRGYSFEVIKESSLPGTDIPFWCMLRQNRR